jgi:RimJ/RimL family protein N-acetyltransferase
VTVDTLKNGTAITVRKPTMDDLERMRRFLHYLPEEERRYLRVDVTKREVVEHRIRQAESGEVHRLIALTADDKVVGVGSLERFADTWKQHLAEIRVIVGPNQRNQRLGALLVGRLFRAAQTRGIEQVVVKAAAPQTAARKICERLGFHVDAVLPKHVKDATGELQDMVIMRCTLDELWHELNDFYRVDDWPDG